MIIGNNAANLSTALVRSQAIDDYKRFIAGQIDFNTFWSEFKVVAKAIAKTGFDTVPLSEFPKKFMYKNAIEITIYMPYVSNMAFMTGESVTMSMRSTDVYYPNKTKKVINVPYVSQGIFFESPLHMVINAYVQREFAALKRDIVYPTLDNIGKQRLNTQLADLDTTIAEFSELSGGVFLFPEHIFVKQDNHMYFNTYLDTPWVNGIERESTAFLSPGMKAGLDLFMNSSVDTYKGVFGAVGGIEEIKVILGGYGVLIEPRDIWVKIPNSRHITAQMDESLRKYLQSYSGQVLAMFPHFLKNTYAGFELSSSELAATVYDFGRVLSKLFGVKVKVNPDDMVSDKYELLTSIRSSLGLSTTAEDLIDFTYYHALRTGALNFEVVGDVELTLDEMRLVRTAMANLRNPLFALDEAERNRYVYKATQRLIGVTCPNRVIDLKVVGQNFVIESDRAVKSIMNPSSSVGYALVELMEAIEGIYLACLDSTLTTSDIYNLTDGTYKYKISSAALNKQLHYGFIGVNPTIILARSK